MKKVAAFLLCPKSLPEAKYFWKNLFSRGNSKNPGIDSVLWLLVLILMKIYIEKEQANKRKMENVQIEKKGASISR